MSTCENIVICDESALHFYLHADTAAASALGIGANPLAECAESAEELCAFNTTHPLYGGEPVDVLVPRSASRRQNNLIKGHCCNYDLPASAFRKLRDGLYITSPELTFARLGYGRSEAQLARIGVDLCGRYFVPASAEQRDRIRNASSGRTHEHDAYLADDGRRDPGHHASPGRQRDQDARLAGERQRGPGRYPDFDGQYDRSAYLTTPERLRDFLDSVPLMRGASKARRALRWVIANSGSPMETKLLLQLTWPMRAGGFALPFHALNYDVSARRYASIAEQGDYCIDLVNLDCKVGVEYDGELYHLDASADKRRRNALAALNWQVFPIDKRILLNPEATEKAAHQIARKLGRRLQKPPRWEERYIDLRHDLGLPA